MPVPISLVKLIVSYAVRIAPGAYSQAGRVVEKYVTKKFGKYVVEIERRNILGRDRGISQTIRILLNNLTQEVHHIVSKAGEIIHHHIKYRK